jgi:hypothetical protein
VDITVVSLHGELRTLRDAICTTCKQKFVLANIVSSQAPEPQDPVESGNSTFLWSSLLNAVSDPIPIGSGHPTEIHKPATSSLSFTLVRALPISSTPTSLLPPVFNTVHGNEKVALISDTHSMVASSSRTTTPQSVTGDPSWSVRRDAIADPVIDVAFVCTFSLKDAIQSVRFSADGKFLAAALKDGNHFNNGRILIYDVETGKQSWSVSIQWIRYFCPLTLNDSVIAEYSSQYSSKEKVRH